MGGSTAPPFLGRSDHRERVAVRLWDTNSRERLGGRSRCWETISRERFEVCSEEYLNAGNETNDLVD